jgi:hypothetical protein
MAGKDKSYKWTEDKLIRFDACFECGITKDECIIHYHHVVPHSRGGKNAIPLCVNCHDIVHANHRKNKNTNPLDIVKLLNEGRKNAIARGVRFGRKEGATETKEYFMNKPKSKEIVELLKKGKTYRDIEDITGVAPKKIAKVRKFLIEDGVIQVNEKNGRVMLYQRKFF